MELGEWGLLWPKGNVRTSLPKPSSLHAKGGRVNDMNFSSSVSNSLSSTPHSVVLCKQ